MASAPMLFHDPAPRATRLALADGLALPDGPVAIYRPRAGEDFDALPRARVHMVQSFWPDHAAFRAAGWQVGTEPVAAPTALICLPRAKAEGLALIAEAVARGAQLVIVDGQKTDGIEAMLKAVRARVPVENVISKAHGKLFWFAPQGADFSDWAARPQRIDDPSGVFETLPGVFSADAVDPASQLLAEHLPARLPARMADLGAGWGYLARACLAREGVEALHLVEAEAQALALAERNLADPRAVYHWADALSVALPGPMGGVVMNPPFHAGRSAAPALGLAFITAAARLLGTGGTLWMVANRHLPYEPALAEGFARHDLLAETSRFRVWQATAPRKNTVTPTRIRARR